MFLNFHKYQNQMKNYTLHVLELILIYYFKEDLGTSFSSIASILIIMFNLLIYLISLRENKEDFLNSTENVANIKNIQLSKYNKAFNIPKYG